MSGELTALLDRLELVHQEIAGLTVFRTAPPATAIKNLSLPLIYPVFTGFEETGVDYATVYRTYSFDVIVLSESGNRDKVDTSSRSTEIAALMVLTDTISDHYNQRRQLKPAALTHLTGMILNMRFNCEGTLLENPMNDKGNAYFMTVFNLTVEMTIESETNF